MKRRLFMLAATGLCVSQAYADPTGEISRRLAEVSVLRGQFAQEKRVSGFRNPLRSQGRFVLARDRGVIWNTEHPFASEVVITATQIRTRQVDGRLRVEMDSTMQPGLRVVNSLLFSVLSGNLRALGEVFTIQESAPPTGGWQLLLAPKPGPLTRVLTRVALAGDAFVNQVGIDEQNGDQTSIIFSNQKPGLNDLTRDELARFE